MKLVKLDIGFKDEILNVWKIAFEGDEEFEDDICKKFFSQPDLWKYAYGWIDDNKLISTYLSLEVKVLIRNKEFRAHYIDGLATLPSYRRRGLIHQQMLSDAKLSMQNNIPLMLVDPSRDSFYRKFGFEYALDRFKINIDKSFFSTCSNRPGCRVISGRMSDKELQAGYKKINKWLRDNSRYNEMIWPPCYEDIKFLREDLEVTVVYVSNNLPVGYILYYIENKHMILESFRYMTLDAFHVLKTYMLTLEDEINTYSFNSIPQDFPIDLLVDDFGRPEKRLVASSHITRMMRITDFQSFLEKSLCRMPSKPICMYIQDDILKENSGFYTILPTGNVIRSEEQRCYISCTISDIVPFLSGLKSAEELYYNGKLKVNRDNNAHQSRMFLPEIIKEISYVLPKVVTYNADEYLAP